MTPYWNATHQTLVLLAWAGGSVQLFLTSMTVGVAYDPPNARWYVFLGPLVLTIRLAAARDPRPDDDYDT